MTGKPIFYDFYTAAQKQEQPAKANTGLFFFRGKPGAPFAVISPGGGFSYVGSIHEGFPYAVEISNEGLQRVRAEIPRGTWRRGRHARPGCRHLVHFPQRGEAWRQHRQLFLVGQFGGRADGGRDRLAWRRERSEATIFQSRQPS